MIAGMSENEKQRRSPDPGAHLRPPETVCNPKVQLSGHHLGRELAEQQVGELVIIIKWKAERVPPCSQWHTHEGLVAFPKLLLPPPWESPVHHPGDPKEPLMSACGTAAESQKGAGKAGAKADGAAKREEGATGGGCSSCLAGAHEL